MANLCMASSHIKFAKSKEWEIKWKSNGHLHLEFSVSSVAEVYNLKSWDSFQELRCLDLTHHNLPQSPLLCANLADIIPNIEDKLCQSAG